MHTKKQIITNNYGQYLKLDYGFHDWVSWKSLATVFTNDDQAKRVLKQTQSMNFPKQLIEV